MADRGRVHAVGRARFERRPEAPRILSDPPYRIVTDRLVVRCWEPRDAPLLKDAIKASLGHLQQWMPWAAEEPTSLEEKVALLRRFRGDFDLGTNFVYGIFDRDESKVVGGTGLHTRVGEDAFEIGYWIHVDRVREGLVTESTAALTRVALELCDADRVEIKVDPANVASLGVPRKLGYLEEATLRRRLPGQRDVVVWTLFKDALASSPAAKAWFEAYDAVGARIQ